MRTLLYSLLIVACGAGGYFLITQVNTPASTQKEAAHNETTSDTPTPTLRSISYNGVSVDVWIEEIPKKEKVDLLLIYHGTTGKDAHIIDSARTILEKTRAVVRRSDLVMVSVAYPEEGLLFGDNIKQAEAALLWAKHNASKELNIPINKLYLFGHSQGGYLVTRLNTLHETDGVIASAPGPIDLSYRCQFDERSIKTSQESVCALLRNAYGSVFDNPVAYQKRSLVSFTSGYKSRILFVQGLEDSDIQMKLWPGFKSKVEQCRDCATHSFLELPDVGHGAVFESPEGIAQFNTFLNH